MQNALKNLSRSYLAYGICWILVMTWIMVLNPVLGIASIEDLNKPDIVLPLVFRNKLILLFPALDILLGCSLFVLSLLQYSISQKKLMDEAIKYAGLFAALLFVCGAYSRITTFQMIAEAGSFSTPDRNLAFDIVNFMQYGNSAAVQFLLSVWILLSHYLPVKRHEGNLWVHLTGIAGGLAGLFAIVYQPLSFLLIVANMFTALYTYIYIKVLKKA